LNLLTEILTNIIIEQNTRSIVHTFNTVLLHSQMFT
jgi:hypothetical protein